MKKITAISIILLTFASLSGANKLPNVILYLLDDVGFGSTNFNGAPKELLQTPHMDSLATAGVNFTNAHTTSAVCSPTRYALLTGRYAWRTQMKFGAWGNAPALISEEIMTLPQMLKWQGYQTAIVGKWHLGFGPKGLTNKTIDFRKNTAPGPNERGFDYSFCIPNNHGDDFGVWIENGKIWGLRSDELKDFGDTYYGPKFKGYDAPQRVDEDASQMCTDMAIKWMKSVDKNKPFFLYFASPIAHEPITPSKKRAGTSKGGSYCEFLMDGDDSVGQIIDYLKKNKLFDNTIFILTSDNGGQGIPWWYDRVNPKPYNKYPDGHPLLRAVVKAEDAGLRLNGDYRGGKARIWDGGTRVPFVIYWKGNIEGGKTNNQAFSLVDIWATLAKVTGFNLEAEDNCAPDSVNVLNLWKGEKQIRENIVTHSVAGIFAIRTDDMKYIEGIPYKGQGDVAPSEGEAQLYNLKEDIEEEKNLLSSHSAEVEKFQKILNEMRK